MATGDLVTEDYGFEFRGFAFGGSSAGLQVAPGLTGFYDLPDVRSSDQTRLRRHGELAGDDFLSGRELVIPIEVVGANVTTWSANLDGLKLAMAVDPDRDPIEDALVFQLPGIAGGGKRRVYCRPRGLAGGQEIEWFYNIPTVTARFWSTSPNIYDNSLTTVVSPILTGGSTGMSWPIVWPLSWGSVSASSFSATNAGTKAAEWTATITGPIVNPSIQHLDLGLTLLFTITLGVGDTLVVDSDGRTVLLGGSNRYYVKSGDWFSLGPGANTLSFRADSGTGTLTLTYRSTWG